MEVLERQSVQNSEKRNQNERLNRYINSVINYDGFPFKKFRSLLLKNNSVDDVLNKSDIELLRSFYKFELLIHLEEELKNAQQSSLNSFLQEGELSGLSTCDKGRDDDFRNELSARRDKVVASIVSKISYLELSFNKETIN